MIEPEAHDSRRGRCTAAGRWQRARRATSLATAMCLATAALTGCGFTGQKLAEDPPLLADMEEPLELFQEPDDEAERKALPAGAFSGVYVSDSRQSLEALLGDPEGVLVERVIENSPGDLAGVRDGDLLLEATVAGADEPIELSWPSEWREIEIDNPPGTTIQLLLDRAAREIETELTLIPRARSAPRVPGERFRDADRVGVVVRTATEVEARRADLPPGGGAVVVGLAAGSPWRAAGLEFGDLITRIDKKRVTHPQVVLDAIREAGKRDRLTIQFMREGEAQSVRAPVSRRLRHMTEFKLPLLFTYENDRGRREISAILGLLNYRSTSAAWQFRFLYLFRFGGGKADRLKEVNL